MGCAEFSAMGTRVAVLAAKASVAPAAAVVRALFETWEAALSRFLPESELSRLNRSTGPVAVSPLLYTVLSRALAAAAATGGLFDPALLTQLEELGYDRPYAEVVARGDTDRAGAPPARRGGQWRAVRLDPVRRTVTVPSGVRLDLGGIAKGMAVDAAIEALRERGLTPAMVNAGGDLAVIGHPPGLDHWPVALQAAPGRPLVALVQGALATSGIGARRWSQGGQPRHHLLHPRTGRPTDSDLAAVTVAASRCEQADVAAKVALISGSREGRRFLLSHRLAGLLVFEDGRQDRVGDWPGSD